MTMAVLFSLSLFSFLNQALGLYPPPRFTRQDEMGAS